MLRITFILSLLSSPALAFQARNDLTVTGDEAGFTVAASAGQSAPFSWCAAGDFVIRALGKPSATPIYRISPTPRRAGQGVQFSLNPEGAAPKSGLIEFGDQDGEVPAGHAQGLCQNRRDAF